MRKSPENEVFLMIIERFSPLINYYARKLGTDSARLDLTEFLIELLSRRKGLCDKYIAVCLRNEYIRLSREKCDFSLRTVELFDLPAMDFDVDLHIDIERALSGLSKLQFDILMLHFNGGFTVTEIAKMKGISRQAVNNCKLRAFEKMRDELNFC